MGLQVFDERFPSLSGVQIVAADTTTLKQLVSVGQPGGLLIDAILLSNTDGIDHNVDFWFTLSAVNYGIGSIKVPAGAGKAGVAAVDAVPWLYPNSRKAIIITNLSALYFSVEVSVVTGAVQGVAFGGYT